MIKDKWRSLWRSATSRPHGASQRTSCLARATLFAVVGALALASLALSPQTGAVLERSALGMVAGVLAVVVARCWQRLPAWALWVFHCGLSLGVAVCVARSSTWIAALSCAALYVLLLTQSFFVLSWAEAVVEFCLGASFLVVALVSRGGTDAGSLVLLVGVVAANCVVTGWLVRVGDRADLDALTGVLGRRGTQPAAESLLVRAGRDGSPLTVALIDMDHFKGVNDLLGHAAGDALLVALADAARAVVPIGAVFGRWGGDEFVLVLAGDAAAACAVVDALRGRLPAERTLSAGLAERVSGDDLASLLGRADHALYDVKRTQRGRSAVAGADPQTGGELVEDAAGPVATTFSPVVELAGEEVVAAAAALGAPSGPDAAGVLRPLFGQVPEAGSRLLRGALDAAVAWAPVERAVFTGTPGPMRLLVRLGTGQDAGALARSALVVLDTLRESGADPERLVVAVPERLLDAASDLVREAVAPLRALGVRVVVTDVGSGAISLARLLAAPADGFSLSPRLLPAPGAAGQEGADLVAALTRSLGAGGRDVGIGGITTPEQAAWALAHGCTHGWGPLWPSAEAGALVQAPVPSAGVSSSQPWLDSQPSMRSDAGS